jgi:hypothetical protein
MGDTPMNPVRGSGTSRATGRSEPGRSHGSERACGPHAGAGVDQLELGLDHITVIREDPPSTGPPTRQGPRTDRMIPDLTMRGTRIRLEHVTGGRRHSAQRGLVCNHERAASTGVATGFRKPPATTPDPTPGKQVSPS